MAIPQTYNRRDMIKRLAGSAALTAILPLSSCESVTTTLELIITTTSAAVDIAFPQYAALLNPYFTSVSNFIDQVNTELASTDTTAQKAVVIAMDAAAIVQPDLSGLAGEVVTRVLAIAPLIAKLVDEIKGLSAEIQATPGGANAFFAEHKKFKQPSAEELAKIRAKNAALKARLLPPKKR
jgi:hypothetical protein